MSNQEKSYPIVFSKVIAPKHLEVRHLEEWNYARILIILDDENRRMAREVGFPLRSFELDHVTVRAALRDGIGNRHRLLRGSNTHIDTVLEVLPNERLKVLTIIDNRDLKAKKHFVDEFTVKMLSTACRVHDSFNVAMRALRIMRDSEAEGAEALANRLIESVNGTDAELNRIAHARRQEEDRLRVSNQEREAHRQQEEQRKLDGGQAQTGPQVPTSQAKPKNKGKLNFAASTDKKKAEVAKPAASGPKAERVSVKGLQNIQKLDIKVSQPETQVEVPVDIQAVPVTEVPLELAPEPPIETPTEATPETVSDPAELNGHNS